MLRVLKWVGWTLLGLETIGSLQLHHYSLLVVLWGAVIFGILAFRHKRAGKARTEARGLAARADYQHAALMRGDVRGGVHGAFPPVTGF